MQITSSNVGMDMKVQLIQLWLLIGGCVNSITMVFNKAWVDDENVNCDDIPVAD